MYIIGSLLTDVCLTIYHPLKSKHSQYLILTSLVHVHAVLTARITPSVHLWYNTRYSYYYLVPYAGGSYGGGGLND